MISAVFSQSNQPDTSAPGIGGAEWASAGDSIWAGRLQQRPPRQQQPFELWDCMLAHAVGRKQICSFWGFLQVGISSKSLVRSDLLLLQVISDWNRVVLLYMASFLTTAIPIPLIFWDTYTIKQIYTVICPIFISCLKVCFDVHAPLDVAAAQSEASARSLISGHNRKNATNLYVWAAGLVVHSCFSCLPFCAHFLLLCYLWISTHFRCEPDVSRL